MVLPNQHGLQRKVVQLLMIEKIQIRGFGANEKLDVEFSPNVTSIVGKSFIGKSWMLRALRWVMRNKPAGDSFINWDSDEAKVRLSIDSEKVIRIRNKNTNSYRLSDKSKSYVAFGNDVPRDIAEFVNVSEINFQTQHTAPFWFCETAGEVSRQLNSIINLEVIDSTLANIASELFDTRAIIKVTEKSLLKAIQEKKELAYVEDLNIELKRVESLQDQYKSNVEKRSRIDANLNLVAEYAYIRENAARQASDGLKVVSIGDSYSKIAVSVENLSKSIEYAQNLKLALENRPPSIRPLEKLKEKTERINIQYDRLDILIESVESKEQKKNRIKQNLTTLKKELEKTVKGRCPLCGAKMQNLGKL